MQLHGKLFITGQVHVLTGLAIGGSTNDFSIGGVENTVIKTSKGIPFIPGSSLKGKLRSLLEKSKGKKDVCKCGDCPICAIFGVGAGNKDPKSGITRLYVRDAFMNDKVRVLIESKKNQFTDLELRYTEVKTENVIDRLTSTAKHPRPMERVPAGAKFDLNMVYNILDQTDVENLRYLITAIRMLEDDYLGGNGSRGYGRVAFENLKIWVKTLDAYEGNNQPDLISDAFFENMSFNELRDLVNQKFNF